MKCFIVLITLVHWSVTLENDSFHVSFDLSLDDILKDYIQEGYVIPKTRHKAIQAIKDAVKQSQQNAFDAIRSINKNYTVKVSWVTNTLIIENPDDEIISKLKTINGISATMFVPNHVVKEESPVKNITKNHKRPVSVEDHIQWNILQIRAPEVWKLGFTGKGITVATIGSGAYVQHDLLRSKYRGDKNYGWYEPAGEACGHDHGFTRYATLRIGHAVADGGYGVAPGANFMCCAVNGHPEYFDQCVSWIMCPHNGGNEAGTDEDCSKAPSVVGIANDIYNFVQEDAIQKSIDMLTKMGITVVTDAGEADEASQCNKISSGCKVPSSICCGFTNSAKQRSIVSNCGSTEHNFKPDLLVPGIEVSGPDTCDSGCLGSGSCIFTDKNGEAGASGHVLGVIALVLSKNKTLKPSQIKKILLNASQAVEDERYLCCDMRDEDDYPNFCSGFGLLDAKKAIDITPLN